MVASMVRKAGGFTFQELNLAIDDIKNTSELGADLSYDFVTRPAYHHALATGDTEFLRLTMTLAAGGTATDLPCACLAEPRRADLRACALRQRPCGRDLSFGGPIIRSGPGGQDPCGTHRAPHRAGAPYNAIFTTNGIACTTASDHRRLSGLHRPQLPWTAAQIEAISRAHLLPPCSTRCTCVFPLSGWDLFEAFTLDRRQVADLIGDGDTPWIHRPAYDLMDYRPEATESTGEMPRGRALYGPLPAQLDDPAPSSDG